MAFVSCLLFFCAFNGIFAFVLPSTNASGCTYFGKTYPYGTFHPSPCIVCECYGGGMRCPVGIKDCIPTGSLCVNPVKDADQCCLTCPDGKFLSK